MIAISFERPGIGHIVAVRPDITLVHGLSPVMNIILAYGKDYLHILLSCYLDFLY